MSLLPLLTMLTAAWAAPERGVAAGLYGGAWGFSADEQLDTTWTAVPRLGYQFAPRFTAELDVGYLQGLTRTTDSAFTVLSSRLNLLYNIGPEWKVQPGAVIGGGAARKTVNWESDSGDSTRAGGYKNPDLDPLLNVGPAVLVPIARRFSVRTDLRYALDLGGDQYTLINGTEISDIYSDWEWTLGLMFHPGPPKEPEPVPIVEPEPEPEGEPEDSLSVDPSDAMVWIPHPICQWVPADSSDAALAEAETALRVTAPGYLPSEVKLNGPTSVALEPAPEQGSVVVIATPGDAVLLGEQVLSLGADGTAVINAPIGPLTLDVTGGGRAETRDLVVASGYGVWVRFSTPEDVELLFPMGVSALSPEGLDAVATLGELSGDSTFEIQGSYSPEGDQEANRALAEARARAAGQALIDAGVPEERVIYVPSDDHDEDDEQKAESLRSVRIHPSGAKP